MFLNSSCTINSDLFPQTHPKLGYTGRMYALHRVAVGIILALPSSTAIADGIKPGLWRVIAQSQNGGIVGPPQASSKCLTPDQTRDLPTTFSPISRTTNSDCAPIERNFTGDKLTWRLICKGQLDMELNGEFNFDSPQHYSGSVRTHAAIQGMITDTENRLDAEWVSECP